MCHSRRGKQGNGPESFVPGRDSWTGPSLGTPYGRMQGAGPPDNIAPMDRAGRMLVVSDGSVAGLLASAIASDRSSTRRSDTDRNLVWCPFTDARAKAVERQADLFRLEALTSGRAPPPDVGSERIREVARLVAAGCLAADRGMARVTWPVNAGPGPEPDLGRAALAVASVASPSRTSSRKRPAFATAPSAGRPSRKRCSPSATPRP